MALVKDKPADVIEVYKSNKTGFWHWRYRSGGNGRILADSGEGYVQKAQAIKMACRVSGVKYELGMIGFERAASYLTGRERAIKLVVIK